MNFTVKLSPRVIEQMLPVHLTYFTCENVTVKTTDEIIEKEFSDVIDDVSSALTTESLSQDKIIKLVREMFKAFGTDPTKYRPSAEAMIRRIIKDKGLYRINNVIDINNLVSVRYRVPIGVYDLAAVNGHMAYIDIGSEGEKYTGITGREYNAEGKPVLKDSSGIFGSPIADSGRTMIKDSTDSLLVVFYSHIEKQAHQSLPAANEYIRLLTETAPNVTCSEVNFAR